MTPGSPAAGIFADLDGDFLDENGDRWSARRLLGTAGEIARRVPPDAPAQVAIRSGSPAVVLASLLGLWRQGRYGLLLDPALKDERPSSSEDGRAALPSIPDATVGTEGGETGRPEAEGGMDAPALPADDSPFVAFRTSGSTGEPKMVLKKTFQFARQLEVEPGHLGLAGPLSVLSLVPAHHILGFLYGLFYPVRTGGRVAFSLGTGPQVWERIVREREPQLVVGVPSHYRYLSRVLERPLPRAVYLTSGAPLSQDVDEAFRRRAGSPLVQVYGSTEAGGIATRSGDETWRPLPGLRFKTDEEDRLWIASAWQEDPAGWNRTDDLAQAAGTGFRLLGRADSIVKVGGRRFSTEEVIRAAQAVPEIDQAVAVVYHRYGEPAVALFVTPRGAARPTSESVREALRTRLAAFKLPRTLRVLDALPMRGIGKVDAQALKKLAEPDSP